MKEKVCFVVQRYGIEVNGGAELQCRLFAEHLNEYYDVDVVTTKAISYMTWKDEYVDDSENINGVNIHRFSVAKERNQDSFNSINGRFMNEGLSIDEEQEWIDEQGPYCPDMIDYIRNHKDEYKAFVFFTYLYYPAVMGLPLVSDKSIFIPEAHNEPFLKMVAYRRLFYRPRAFFFNTEEERYFVQRKFKNYYIPSDIGGIGIDIPIDTDADRFKNKYSLDNYIIYAGRIDENKGCDKLFEYFIEYKKRNEGDIKLVLMGKAVIDIPERDDIISLGFVDESDKIDGMAGARLLVLPSKYESLSMVVLEAMSVKTPVMVNGQCDVLKGHCVKSNGAFYYNNYFEFEGQINYILDNNDVVDKMCKNALEYVENNYKWDVVTKKLTKLIEEI